MTVLMLLVVPSCKCTDDIPVKTSHPFTTGLCRIVVLPTCYLRIDVLNQDLHVQFKKSPAIHVLLYCRFHLFHSFTTGELESFLILPSMFCFDCLTSVVHSEEVKALLSVPHTDNLRLHWVESQIQFSHDIPQ